jgi:hypothetical protein
MLWVACRASHSAVRQALHCDFLLLVLDWFGFTLCSLVLPCAPGVPLQFTLQTARVELL